MRLDSMTKWMMTVAAVSLLAGCGLLQGSEQKEFAVSATPPQDGPYRTKDANAADTTARAYCADGYDKLDQATQPTDGGTMEVWKIRCTPYQGLKAQIGLDQLF